MSKIPCNNLINVFLGTVLKPKMPIFLEHTFFYYASQQANLNAQCIEWLFPLLNTVLNCHLKTGCLYTHIKTSRTGPPAFKEL